jgi:galactose mutarotase-like enzyme
MIDLITLRTANSSVTIAPSRGALVTSLIVCGQEVLYLDDDTFRDTSKNVRGGIPVLFPSPGKLSNDTWQYAGQTGVMKQHGFARTEAWTPTQQTPRSLICALASNDSTLAQFPWIFKAELEFTLSDRALRITFQLQNTGDTTMPFGIGYHPYFRVSDKAHARIPTTATQAFDNRLKAIHPFTGFDFTQEELDIHLLDHRSRTCDLLADGSRIVLRTAEDFSLWVIWTLAGKDFVCMEPWSSPGNAINSGERLLTLPAGERHESWIEVEVEK